MTEQERSDYLIQKLLLETEREVFNQWYRDQYEHKSLKRVRQAAFRKEMESRLARMLEMAVPVEVFEILERIEIINEGETDPEMD